jgi:hypothetical protein
VRTLIKMNVINTEVWRQTMLTWFNQ